MMAVLSKLMLLLAILVAQALLVSTATACPVCDTGTGQQVRAGIFDEDFVRTLVAVALPFPLLLAVVAAIHFGWPRAAGSTSPPTDGGPRDGHDER